MKLTMQNCLRTAAIGALAMCLPAFAQSSNSNSQSNQDAQFLSQVSKANQKEIATAKLAQEKASNPMVKDFAKQLQDDHQDAQNELQQVAQKDNLNVETSTQPQAPQALQNESGSQFDQDFIQHEIKDHQKTIAKLQAEKSSLQEQNVKHYATDVMPTLQAHLKTAQHLASQLGINTTASNDNR